jgi:hypothetical protein
MILYTGCYGFTNPDGQVIEFGPGDGVRRFTSNLQRVKLPGHPVSAIVTGRPLIACRDRRKPGCGCEKRA